MCDDKCYVLGDIFHMLRIVNVVYQILGIECCGVCCIVHHKFCKVLLYDVRCVVCCVLCSASCTLYIVCCVFNVVSRLACCVLRER